MMLTPSAEFGVFAILHNLETSSVDERRHRPSHDDVNFRALGHDYFPEIHW